MFTKISKGKIQIPFTELSTNCVFRNDLSKIFYFRSTVYFDGGVF